MSFRGSARGATMLGVLLMLALLSAAALSIESQSVAINRGTQIAATAATPPSNCSGSGWEKNSNGECLRSGTVYEEDEKGEVIEGYKVNTPAYLDERCEVGEDFMLTLNRDGLGGVLYQMDAQGNRANIHTRTLCSSIGDASVVVAAQGERKARSCVASSAEPGVKPWKCYLKICRRVAIQGKTEELDCDFRGIVEGKNPIAINEPIAGVAGDTVAARTSPPLGDSEIDIAKKLASPDADERDSGRVSLGRLNTETQRAILGQSQEYVRAGIETLKEDQKRYAEELQRLGDCTNVPISATVSNAFGNCEEEKASYEALMAYNQEAIKALEEQKKRLAADIKALTPQARPNPFDDFADRQRRPDPPGLDIGYGTDRYAHSTFGLAGISGNDRIALEDACRRGETRACQILAGVAQPGYGASSPHPQCGSSGFGRSSSGGLFGVITGIISLFKKDNNQNGNCVDGVPKPTCSITASPASITSPGQSVTLSWQSQNGFSASLSNEGSVAPNGSMVVEPQKTTTYTLSVQGYKNTQTGEVLSGQCSTQVRLGAGTTSSNGTDPKAQISCSPQLADVGMSVAISYACTNANTSAGTGFATGNQMSGSATPSVEAPVLGSNNKVTYGLTCSKEGKTDTAECTVDVNKTSIVLVANPQRVKSGKEANIGWITSGMDSCTISSPDLAGFTSDNAGKTAISGVAKTPALTAEARFTLSCTTKAGGTKTAEVKVEME